MASLVNSDQTEARDLEKPHRKVRYFSQSKETNCPLSAATKAFYSKLEEPSSVWGLAQSGGKGDGKDPGGARSKPRVGEIKPTGGNKGPAVEKGENGGS